MAIGTYAELQTAIAGWLNRDDLTDEIPDFIELAEDRMNRDSRLRQVATRAFTAAQNYTLPTDFKRPISLYHDGPTYYGPLNIVSPNELPIYKARHGDTGVPHFASIIDVSSGPKLWFAPEPSGAYTLTLTYDAMITALSDSNTTNWLLDAGGDLYLYASLCAAEGYLQEDQRIGVWNQKYEDAARQYKKDVDNREFGGRLISRPAMSIGGDVHSSLRRRAY
jgi:hypothetical protein